jgi:transcriptional regulator with XRE-family HTH domain
MLGQLDGFGKPSRKAAFTMVKTRGFSVVLWGFEKEMFLEPTEAVSLRERGALLHRFRKNYGVTPQEFEERAGLSRPMLTRFERGSCGLSMEAWTRVLVAMGKIEKEKFTERNAEFDKLHAEWMESFLRNPDVGDPFAGMLPAILKWPAIEEGQKQILEMNKSSLELSTAIAAQWLQVQAEVAEEN